MLITRSLLMRCVLGTFSVITTIEVRYRLRRCSVSIEALIMVLDIWSMLLLNKECSILLSWSSNTINNYSHLDIFWKGVNVLSFQYLKPWTISGRDSLWDIGKVKLLDSFSCALDIFWREEIGRDHKHISVEQLSKITTCTGTIVDIIPVNQI